MKKKGKHREVFYRQCSYSSPTENGKTVGMSWLPEKFAEVGRKIYFGKRTDNPEKIFTIESVGDKRMSESYLVEHERDWKTQREASDI